MRNFFMNFLRIFVCFGILQIVLFLWLGIPFEGEGFKVAVSLYAIAFVITNGPRKKK